MEVIESVEKGNLELAKSLVNAENVNTVNSQNQNLLLIATKNNDLEMAKFLVQLGADVNQVDNISDTPFLYTGVSGNAKLAKLFLENGAQFNIYNRYNGTTLIPACERGHVEIVKLLANTPNYPIDHINRLGWTALLEAVILGNGSKNYIEIVEILLDAGADKNITDSEGVTPYEHAQRRGFKEIAQLLK